MFFSQVDQINCKTLWGMISLRWSSTRTLPKKSQLLLRCSFYHCWHFPYKAQPWSAYHEEPDLHFACAQKCQDGQHRWFRWICWKCERETPQREQCYLVPYLHFMLLDWLVSLTILCSENLWHFSEAGIAVAQWWSVSPIYSSIPRWESEDIPPQKVTWQHLASHYAISCILKVLKLCVSFTDQAETWIEMAQAASQMGQRSWSNLAWKKTLTLWKTCKNMELPVN